MKRVAVYLGSQEGGYAELAADAGAAIARRGIGIVYGGGRRGLMGSLADAALAAGGEVVGVIPRAMVDREVAHEGLTELVVVESMHERKVVMTERADAFLTLPGGTGTLDEFVEALSWTQLGLHAKPSGLLNRDGFFDGLVAYFDRAARSGFLPDDFERLLLVDDDVEQLLDRLAHWVAPTSSRWLSPPPA